MKYQTRLLNPSKKKKVMIIGMCPGRQRKRVKRQIVFHGNKTGDFIEDILKGQENIFLTNVFNEYVEKIDDIIIKNGLFKLERDIENHKPKLIICMGRFAEKHVAKLGIENIPIISIVHPSYIIRFGKDKNIYKANVLKLIKETQND